MILVCVLKVCNNLVHDSNSSFVVLLWCVEISSLVCGFRCVYVLFCEELCAF